MWYGISQISNVKGLLREEPIRIGCDYIPALNSVTHIWKFPRKIFYIGPKPLLRLFTCISPNRSDFTRY